MMFFKRYVSNIVTSITEIVMCFEL